MLKFDDPKNTTKIPLYEAPIRNGESEDEWAQELARWEHQKAVKIEISQVDPETREEWSYRWMALDAEEKRRLQALRSETTEEENPIIFASGYVTQEGRKARRALGQDVMNGCLTGVEGFMVGNVDVGGVKDKAELIRLLDHVDYLDLATARAIGGQKPSRVESLS